jgi:hypothetical protein
MNAFALVATLMTLGGFYDNPAPKSLTWTEGPMDVYADASAGVDYVGCGTATSPCRSLAMIQPMIPHGIRHQVNIHMAAGSYNGLWMENYFIDRSLGLTAPAGIVVTGALVTATAATGSPSGPVASATAATFTSATVNTVTVTAAGWTVNDFRGKLLVFTSGVLSGKSYPVMSNTATVLTVGGDFTGDGGAPSAADTFQIKDYATKFTGAGFGQPAPPFAWFAAYNSFTWYMSNIGPDVDSIAFKNVWFASDALTDVYVGQNTSATFYYSKFTNSGSFNTIVGLGPASQVNSIGCTYELSTSQVGYLTMAEPFYLIGYNHGTRINSANDISYSTGTKLGILYEGTGFVGQWSSLYTKNIDRGFFVSGSQILINSVVMDTMSFGVAASFTSAGFASVSIAKGYFASCSTSAVILDGRGTLTFTGTEAGVSNALGIVANDGALVQILGTTNIGSTNELQIDGTNFSLATLRAASPQTEISTRTGSRIYQ